MVIYLQNETGFVILGALAEIYEDQRYEVKVDKYKPTIYFDGGASEEHALALGTYDSHERVLEVIEEICNSYLNEEELFLMPKA